MAMRPTTALLSLLLVAAVPSPGAGEDTGPGEALALLRRNGITTDTGGVMACLKRLLPDPQQQAEIARLIAQLADASFAQREAASMALPTFGEAAPDP